MWGLASTRPGKRSGSAHDRRLQFSSPFDSGYRNVVILLDKMWLYRWTTISVLISTAGLTFVVTLSAQSGQRSMTTGPVGLVFPVPDYPLSPEQLEERTRTARDGTVTTERVVSQIYRDRAGRMRIEWLGADPRGSPQLVDLIDPVSRSMIKLLVQSKIAVFFVKPHSESKPFNVGFPAVGVSLPTGRWQAKSERLGTRVISGIEVEGTRTVETSDDHPPLVAVKEEWGSKNMHVTMQVEASGPGWRHTAKLQNLDPHEADPTLFVIPSDYAIQDE